ncbi:MAG: DUF373 family protein [Candidatus Thermoplasmatota archaeon]
MKTLVLCIDRDNDLGRKTGFEGPIIGREECLRAAVALGLSDPEDADTNTLLAALSSYDELVKSGENAEIAAICGDVDVGLHSDRVLMRQLEEVVEVVEPTSAILVTNGAEDEYILPMICSRIPVDSVRSVFVRQSRRIESTYYYIVKNLKDPKLRRKVIAPITLALIVLGIAYLAPFLYKLPTDPGVIMDPSAYALPMLLLALGLFIFWRAYSVSEAIGYGIRRWRDGLYSGDVTLVFVILALILGVVGAVFGYNQGTKTIPSQFEGWLTRLLLGLGAGIPWFALAYIVLEARGAANALLHREPVQGSFLALILSVVGVMFLALAAIHYICHDIALPDAPEITFIIGEGIFGIALTLASLLYQRISKKEVVTVRDKWRR